MPSRMALCLTTCLTACSVGEGSGTVTGAVFVSPCTEDTTLGAVGAPAPYNLNPTFFTADMVNALPGLNPVNHLSIRVQSTGSRIDEADALFINVGDERQVANALLQPIPVGPATNVRAALSLARSCPNQPVQIELDGTVTFSKFGSATGSPVPVNFMIELGDTLAASFAFTIVDRRAETLGGSGSVTTTQMVGGNLSGSFDFQIRAGRSAQAYP